MSAQQEAPPLTVATEETSWFFEGAEKLLELWFYKTSESDKSLRSISRSDLDELCRIAHCEIVSERHDKQLDAYVLSESSLFISDRRLIMKTCGTTRLLDALPKILELARVNANMEVSNVFYSRKNFARPHEQPESHRDFDIETAILDEHFGGGSAHVCGNVNGESWYLYTLPTARGKHNDNGDQTLEILMEELDMRVMDLFTENMSANGRQATELANIAELMPDGTLIDDKLFSPCGYSMNGIVPGTDQYSTIHVTPEKAFSYVSFETNQQQMCFVEQTRRVLACFRPGKFMLTVFADRSAINGKCAQKQIWDCHFDGYTRGALQFLLLPEHTLVYAHYHRLPADDCSSDSGVGDT